MPSATQQRDGLDAMQANGSLVNAAHAIRSNDLEAALATARPRLAAEARRRGIAPDAIDDIVQETLVEAWQHLNALRMPERFDAWLAGICRNMCLRWHEKHRRNEQHLLGLGGPLRDYPNAEDEQMREDIADPAIVDPAEALNQQDLSMLLDRALGYLADDTRQLIELCYLEELPQHEAALRLGLTLDVLEARLHRARKRLRRVLNTEMRLEALAFGLALDETTSELWRPSREWCWYCGRHRLQGAFEPLVGELVTFRMRCPECADVVNTGGLPRMADLHSFRPALKRLWRTIHSHTIGLESGTSFCPMCGESRPACVLHPDELVAAYPALPRPATPRSALVIDCPTCDMHVETAVDGCLIQLPVAQHFMERHPRCVIEPEALLDYAGQPAICFKMTDFTSAAQLTLLVHHRTLRVLALYQA
ncbi:MAG: sigma-70 family RNA polymerase sigma factor [Chloroflexota bacterium]|nr:sigma-70 family RNA polymerase sigma factor [Chloroflexota bacterium]